MSDQDQDSSHWQLGMQLPSRKETHGRKKKGDRKLEKQEKQPQATTESPTATPPVDAEQMGTPEVRPVPPKKERVRYIEAIPEDPQYAAPLEEGTPPAPEKQDAEQQAATLQLQAYWNEAAATATLTRADEALVSEQEVSEESLSEDIVLEEELSQQAGGLSEDDSYLRDLLAGTDEGQDGNDQLKHDAVVADMSVASVTEVAAVEPDLTPEEDDSTPVVAKWKIALLIVITPIVLVVVLAWGKLAYVHQVPAFVQQQVPAYQQGKGFLILKPWWFGPPIFTLDQYERTDGEDFAHWKIQLNDYVAVVDDPTVLYTFPDDIFK